MLNFLKHITRHLSIIVLIFLSSCQFISNHGSSQQEISPNGLFPLAYQHFVDEFSYVKDIRQARSSEITDHYREPQFYEKRFERTFSGEDLVHFCNVASKVPSHMQSNVGNLYNLDQLKEYGLDNYDKVIGYLYFFNAQFTTFHPDPQYWYKNVSANVIVLPYRKHIISYTTPRDGSAWEIFVHEIQSYE